MLEEYDVYADLTSEIYSQTTCHVNVIGVDFGVPAPPRF